VKKLFLFAFMLLIIIINGCGLFKDLGSNFGEGVIEPVGAEADTIGYDLVKGMRESLTEEEFQQELDSMIIRLGITTNEQLRNLLDSLLGESTKYQLGELRDELTGDTTVSRLLYLRNSLLDNYLQNYLNETVSRLGPQFLNDSTIQKLAEVRDTLLGARSNDLIKAIVDSMMITFAGRFKTDVNPLLRDNLSFIEKNATWLLILMGAIALAITAFIWNQKQKYLKMTKLLTYQISEFPEPNSKEALKNNISRNAKAVGVEDELRVLLDKTGLLHLDKRK